MLYFPTSQSEWTAVVRAAYPDMTSAQAEVLAARLKARHPGHPDVQVMNGEIQVCDEGNATVADGWERLTA